MTSQEAFPPPALARASLDRAADERLEDGLVARLRAAADTRVLVVHGDRAPVRGAALHYVGPAEVRGGAEWAFLGRDDAGAPVLVAATAAGDPAPVDDEAWESLRVIGGELPAADAGAFVEALSLGRWLLDAPFCPACGTRTVIRSAGWARTCPACGREHFPRTDPAVIVAVLSADGDRILLGKNAMWAAQNRYSTFAGFVEAGESLESAVGREVFEEAGVTLTGLRYLGSQAWPYPRSLMLGFHATVVNDAAARADGEEIVDVRWFTRDEIGAALRGAADFGLPGTASIAHRLILDWHAG
ncbi:NAD(+) diphosphatase [uncultured Microbacterium sp.]|uniref:NAD(+) diphosphatase n=1 Tax=uncultured Microbacterium sp. TaxID=191216 RepID=A0A1Y5NV59_9MICO|nr:NAD(+) diphosphatase [uncultured Microbacterium sp.]SBS70317.1 NUDIX hydrolase [uncultured Microbacterium sp.]